MSIQDKNTEMNDSEELLSTAPISSPDQYLHENPLYVDNQEKKPDQQKSLKPFHQSIRRFLRDKRAVITLGIIVFLVLLTIVGPPLSHHIDTPSPTHPRHQHVPELAHPPF